jgi:hypothetical protein
MQQLLVAVFFVAVIMFFWPVIFSVAIFFICAAVLMLLLSRFGFLPGVVFKRYGASRSYRQADARSERWFRPEEDERGYEEGGKIWRDTFQEGEEITLPETALRKENDPKKTSD